MQHYSSSHQHAFDPSFLSHPDFSISTRCTSCASSACPFRCSRPLQHNATWQTSLAMSCPSTRSKLHPSFTPQSSLLRIFTSTYQGGIETSATPQLSDMISPSLLVRCSKSLCHTSLSTCMATSTRKPSQAATPKTNFQHMNLFTDSICALFSVQINWLAHTNGEEAPYFLLSLSLPT